MTHRKVLSFIGPMIALSVVFLGLVLALAQSPTEYDSPDTAVTKVSRGAAPTSWKPPRTAWGDPDLEGYWLRGNRTSFNVEGHPGDLLTRPQNGWVVDPPDGRIPYHPWAATKGRSGEFYNNYLDPHVHGVLPGPPRGPYLEHGATQIVQTPGYIVFKMEVQHFYRVIFMDGRPHFSENMKLDMGHSVGRWEEDTLVVDVTNLKARNWLDLAGNFYSDGAHVIERYRLVDPNTLSWEATIEDPYVYTRPWKMAFHVPRQAEPYEQIEEAFREGERDVPRLRDALPSGAIERETLRWYPGVTKTEAQQLLQRQKETQTPTRRSGESLQPNQ